MGLLPEFIGKDKYLIIDFEATTDKSGFPRDQMEIIEIGAVLVDKELNIQSEYNSFVQPVVNPTLTEFCKKLASISQENVENAKRFPSVLEDLISEMIDDSVVFSSWGNYDKNQLKRDCKRHQIEYPFDDHHLNIKTFVARNLGIKPRGIGSVLKYLDMEFVGTPHRGIDDVRNIVRILRKIA